MLLIIIFAAKFSIIIVIVIVSSDVYVYIKRYLKLPKKLWFLQSLKALSFSDMEKRGNTSTEAPLPLMCRDKYPNC